MLALGRQYFLAYATERAQWVQSRALLELLAEDPLVRSGSYIRLMGFNAAVSKQVSYSTYALGGALGGPLTKFVSGFASKRGFTTPDLIEYWMVRLSGFPPREFLDIPPAGNQVNAVCTLARWPESDAALVRRYLWIKWFGQPADWVKLRAQLAKIESRVTREAVPLSPDPPRPKLTPSSPEEGDFINGLGQTMIRLRSGIWAGKYEVTQAEYETLMAANPSQFRDPARPVECVSWHEAREFCRRLTAGEARAGRLPRDHCYSLPTEARWRELATGARLNDAIHNPRGERWHTAPVGTLGPNPQGLHDTWGNVWEWCLDWADRPRHFRLLMGEAWHTERPGKAVTDARHFMRPDQAFWNTGFRCVLVPKSSLPAEFQE
jgi:formylglycine-generating enzyme required for sulfatase activity